MALLVLLITSLVAVFAGGGLVAELEANPVRDLPADVSPGEEFQVTVAFTWSARNFAAIGLAMSTTSPLSMRPQPPSP